jgi:aminopeptidase YwaD
MLMNTSVMRAVPAFLVLALWAAPLSAGAPPRAPADTLTAGLAARLEAHVRSLADDALEGRLVGTPGIEEAAHYIAGEFHLIGLEPLADSSYLQEFSIPFGYETARTPVMSIGERDLVPGMEFSVLPISGSGRIEGLTAFITETGRDEVALEVPRNLSGYIVFCTVNPEIENERWALRGKDGLLDWMYIIARQIAGFGAGAVVFVNGGPDTLRSDLHAFGVDLTHEPLGVPVLEVPYSVLEQALMFEGVTLEGMLGAAEAETGGGFERVFTLDGPLCSLDIETRQRSVRTSNVAGLVPGKVHPDEYVIVGAHYDHLGHGEIASSTPWRREIHNGADDNASGVAALIEIARIAAAAEHLDRSVIFMSFTAEELGAVGSRYYRDHPLRPIGETVAMVNLDTVGRLENDRLIVFGATSADEFDSLLVDVNLTHSLDVVPRKEIFGYSDQNTFVEAGIPSVHFFTGAYDDYHSPDDDWQNLNYPGLAAVTSFAADFVLAVANATARPRCRRPVEAVRISASCLTSRMAARASSSRAPCPGVRRRRPASRRATSSWPSTAGL